MRRFWTWLLSKLGWREVELRCFNTKCKVITIGLFGSTDTSEDFSENELPAIAKWLEAHPKGGAFKLAKSSWLFSKKLKVKRWVVYPLSLEVAKAIEARPLLQMSDEVRMEMRTKVALR